MNAERLLEHYERIADSPDAIARLRRFVLDLAVRGKLVPQDKNNEPAARLLTEIATKKQRFVQSGEIRKGKDLETTAKDCLFDVPTNWEWTRLGAVTLSIQRGKSPKYSTSDGSLVVSQKCVQWAGLDLTVAKKITFESLKDYEDHRFLLTGDLLWNSTGTGTIGRVVRVIDPPPRLVCDSHVTVVRCLGVEPEYIRTWLRTDEVYGKIETRAAGSTNQVELTSQLAVNQMVPLPPLAEQHRIVAKVDELMALCDRLEAARAERETTRDRLAAASLARLNTPDPDPETFKAHARFAIHTALPALTTRPDQIKQLRQTVLNLAVRGKLGTNRGSDAPANVELQNITQERADLISRKAIRNEELPLPPRPDEHPFEVPHGWSWTRVGHVFLYTQYGTSQKSHPSSEGIPVLAMGNIQDGAVRWGDEKRIPATSEELPALYLKNFDILYNRTNSAELVGKTGIYRGPDDSLTFASYLIRLRPSLKYSDPQYLNMALNAPFFRATQIAPLIKKQTGQANVNGSSLKSMLLPLPPIAEQHRIVEKVNELMGICTQLEVSVTGSEAKRIRLLDALLQDALKAPHDKLTNIDDARRRLLAKREAVACRSVERLAPKRGFGRVRAVKLLYFAEAHCGVPLGGQWGRADFGPFDSWIYGFEPRAKSAGWFSVSEHTTTDGGTRVEYVPGPALSAKAQTAAQVLGDQSAEFERVLALLADLNTEDSEIVATLYAAWNDLLLEAKPVSDETVITEFREHWHTRKAAFTPARLRTWLDWMRKNRLVPKGQGPNTRHQAELI